LEEKIEEESLEEESVNLSLAEEKYEEISATTKDISKNIFCSIKNSQFSNLDTTASNSAGSFSRKNTNLIANLLPFRDNLTHLTNEKFRDEYRPILGTKQKSRMENYPQKNQSQILDKFPLSDDIFKDDLNDFKNNNNFEFQNLIQSQVSNEDYQYTDAFPHIDSEIRNSKNKFIHDVFNIDDKNSFFDL